MSIHSASPYLIVQIFLSYALLPSSACAIKSCVCRMAIYLQHQYRTAIILQHSQFAGTEYLLWRGGKTGAIFSQGPSICNWTNESRLPFISVRGMGSNLKRHHAIYVILHDAPWHHGLEHSATMWVRCYPGRALVIWKQHDE